MLVDEFRGNDFCWWNYYEVITTWVLIEGPAEARRWITAALMNYVGDELTWTVVKTRGEAPIAIDTAERERSHQENVFWSEVLLGGFFTEIEIGKWSKKSK